MAIFLVVCFSIDELQLKYTTRLWHCFLFVFLLLFFFFLLLLLLLFVVLVVGILFLNGRLWCTREFPWRRRRGCVHLLLLLRSKVQVCRGHWKRVLGLGIPGTGCTFHVVTAGWSLLLCWRERRWATASTAQGGDLKLRGIEFGRRLDLSGQEFRGRLALRRAFAILLFRRRVIFFFFLHGSAHKWCGSTTKYRCGGRGVVTTVTTVTTFRNVFVVVGGGTFQLPWCRHLLLLLL